METVILHHKQQLSSLGLQVLHMEKMHGKTFKNWPLFSQNALYKPCWTKGHKHPQL